MNTSQKQSFFIPYAHGHIASKAVRFQDANDYKTAVSNAYTNRGLTPPEVINQSSYSFQDSEDEEFLVVWQPDTNYPTGALGSGGLMISYVEVKAKNAKQFNKVYAARTKPGQGNIPKEDPESSMPGRRDKDNTYRAVYQTPDKVATYEGIITNPPYPAKKKRDSLGKAKWLVPAVMGLVTGLAAMPLLRALRAQPGD